MPLTPGTTLGPYSVTAQIGAGGMGEVWRARDTKLDRDVALKVLPDAFTSDPDRLARFEREAKVLASLNHPNIGHIYGLEEAEGTKALVLELVEGPTLADRIAEGPIPVDEALPIAKQIAEALEAAHEQGIIHRDLKPANVKVKADGTVKVLDFGLAKAFQPDASGASASESPTISLTAAATQMGMVIGTAAYMSPEQARGKPVDRRVDIWAFGAVLFEMLTGTKPFPGDDVSQTLARVIDRDPDWNALPRDVPPALSTCVRRCLQKDPRQRVRDIGDVRLAMEGAFETTVSASQAGALQPAGWRQALPWVAALALAVTTGFAVWTFKASPAAPIVRFEIPPAELMTFPGGARALTLSPDGTRLVYEANQQLYVRMRDQREAAPIRGTEGGTAPFFSPDGQWIGFFTANQLKKVSINGGAPTTLCDVQAGLSGTWGPDGTIVYGILGPTGLSRVSAAGGTPEAFSTRQEDEGDHDYPDFLPSGDAVLFTIGQPDQWDDAQLVVQSLDTSERHVVLEGGFYGRFVPTGHLVYARAGGLMAVPFDLRTRRVTGDPAPIVEGVWQGSSGVQFAFSNDGMLAYVPRAASNDRTLALVGRNGMVEPLNVPPAQYLTPRLSPDGGKLVVQTVEDEGNVLWIYDLAGDTQIQQLTFEGDNQRPIWTPDGQRITFSSDRDGTMSLYWMPADGSSVPERLTTGDEGTFHWPGSWSPDGQTLLFNVQRALVTDWDIWTLAGSGEEPHSLYDTPDTVYLGAELSPNGEWLAYGEGPTAATMDIYVEPFPPTGSRRRISQNGGNFPLWSPDGDRLFYRPNATEGGTRLRSVDVITNPDFAFTNEQTLPIEGLIVVPFYRDYDLTPDGEQFVTVFPADQIEGAESSRPQINVVLNWHQELLERVPIN